MQHPIPTESARPHLVCPAGSLRALEAAVEAGADAVYLGLKDATNARNFAGLNFTEAQIREGVALAHRQGAQVLMALNTFADARRPSPWFAAADKAAELGADALIVADTAVMGHCRDHLPGLRLHLSVQASATSHAAIEHYRQRYGVQRAVLPRVVAAEQIARIIAGTSVEIEVFAFGSLCVMVEGRCALSSYATGQSPNNAGVCSPASAVRWQERDGGVSARLNGVLIDHYGPDEPRGYPTLCKGRFEACGHVYHALEEPASLNTLELLQKATPATLNRLRGTITKLLDGAAGIGEADVSALASEARERRPGSTSAGEDAHRVLDQRAELGMVEIRRRTDQRRTLRRDVRTAAVIIGEVGVAHFRCDIVFHIRSPA